MGCTDNVCYRKKHIGTLLRLLSKTKCYSRTKFVSDSSHIQVYQLFEETVVFFILNISSVYWRVEFRKTSPNKSALTSYNEMYRFIRMPFRLKKSLEPFQ